LYFVPWARLRASIELQPAHGSTQIADLGVSVVPSIQL